MKNLFTLLFVLSTLFSFGQITLPQTENFYVTGKNLNYKNWTTYGYNFKHYILGDLLYFFQRQNEPKKLHGHFLYKKDYNLNKGFELESKLELGGKNLSYGLVWNYIDESNYYYFSIFSQNFKIYKVENGVGKKLIYFAKPIINKSGYNTLKIETKGEKTNFYVNGSKVWNENLKYDLKSKVGVLIDNEKNGPPYLNLYIDYIAFEMKNEDSKVVINDSTTDKNAPKIKITSPSVSRGFSIVKNTKSLAIKGTITDESKIYEVLINGQEAYVDANGNFSKNVVLGVGENSFTVKATDVKMNSATKTFTIKREFERKETIITDNTKNISSDIISTGKYYALIIGNNEYKDHAITSLDEPIKDATKLYNVLTTKYAFSKENVTLLKNATYVETITAFDKLGNTLTSNDNLLVFYAGHGWWDEKKDLGYWLPTDARKSNTAFWIRNSTISDYMASIKTKHTLLIADACFSGSIFKTRSAFDNAPLAVKKLNDLPSKKAMTSGNLKEVPDKSVFLKYLVQRLNENTEKYLPADKLFSSFRRAVLANSPNAPQFGTIQNAGDEGGEFIFVKKN